MWGVNQGAIYVVRSFQMSKDPAQLNAALVIHLPLPIYNVRGASLH